MANDVEAIDRIEYHGRISFKNQRIIPAAHLPLDRLIAHRTESDFNGTMTGLRWSVERGGVELEVVEGANYARGTYLSPYIPVENKATEFLPSWNIDLNEEHHGYRIWLRYLEPLPFTIPSPWFYLGSGGKLIPRSSKTLRTKTVRWGEVKVDYLVASGPPRAIQYKVELISRGRTGSNIPPPLLRRFFVCCNVARTLITPGEIPHTLPRPGGVHIPVPYRSQRKVPDKAIRHEVCCPTCVAMMMEHHGINRRTLEVCGHAYDKQYKIYGVWPRACQTASLYGLESWVDRFRTHEQVYELLNAGQPIMASIKVKEGELRGARYKKSNGHLILIVGYLENGDYLVNDPYSEGPGKAEIAYCATDIEQVWLLKGGVGIIIRKPTN